MTAWIGDTFASETGWNHLERLVDVGNRMAGSDGERRGAEATRDALEDVGVRDVHLDTFEVVAWERGSAAITADGRELSCIALPKSPSTAATGELVDVGHGLPADFDRDLEGAVVMAATDVPDWHDRFIHRQEKYGRAIDAGAAAFVFKNHVEGCLAPTGSVSSDDSPVGAIPAVGVSAEVGAQLRRRHEGEQVAVSVEAEVSDGQSQTVHADVGPDTDDAVLLTSHVDAHDIAEGAGDNAAGTAVVLEVAKALVAREADLDTRVHIACFGAEEVGLVGSRHDAATRDPESVRAVVNNDGVVRNRSLELRTNGFDDLDAPAEAVADQFDHPIEINPKLGPHSDHWPYVKRGVPGYHVSSQSETAGRGWGHTRADTLDKLEARNLREQAILLTELVVQVADRERTLARRSPDDIASQAEAEDLAEGLRHTGEWPLGEA